MAPSMKRVPRARALALIGAALVVTALVGHGITRWAIARRLSQVAATRGLTAHWDVLELRFPLRVTLSGLAFMDPARRDTVFQAASLSVDVDPLSVVLLHPRAHRIELAHARAHAPQARRADPDTLAPEEEMSHRGRRERSEKVQRAAESLVRTLLLPARRLPRIELKDVALSAGGEEGEP